MKINSIRFKTSILFSCILAVILAVYSSVIFYNLKRIMFKDLDQELQIKAVRIESILNAYAEINKRANHPFYIMRKLLSQDRFETDEKAIIDELWNMDVKSLGLNKDFFRIYNKKGTPILKSEKFFNQIANLFQDHLTIKPKEIYYKTIKEKGFYLRAINYPILYDKKFPLLLHLATPIESITSILEHLLFFIILSIAGILLLTSFLGSYLTKRILSPIFMVTKMAESISHKDLGVRIKEREPDQEIKENVVILSKDGQTFELRLKKEE